MSWQFPKQCPYIRAPHGRLLGHISIQYHIITRIKAWFPSLSYNQINGQGAVTEAPGKCKIMKMLYVIFSTLARLNC